MARTPRMTYRTAVKLLSGTDPGIEKALDEALSGALLAASPVLGPAAVALIDLKNDIVKHGAALIGKLTPRLRGMPVLERAHNVRAAWTVLAVSALCQATVTVLSDARWPNATALRKELEDKQLRRITGGMSRALADAEVPFPRSDQSYSDITDALRKHFAVETAAVVTFLEGLAEFDRLTERDRKRLTDVPSAAVEEFDRMLRRLASDVPELMVWLMLHESQASRVQLTAGLETGLAGLRQMLESILATEQAPESRWHRSLAKQYAFELTQPLIDIDGEAAMGAVAPPTAQGYLNPRYRITHCGMGAGAEFAAEEWWERLPVREDLQEFLAALLLTEEATTLPLLILGHPGAGKSMLTRVLAGQLPPARFSPVRVTLRTVAASSSVLTQIETALHQTIHEQVAWPAFVESLDGALPVVILDGFDELIQATGVSRSDYLEQVQAFQESESAQGRPVAVLVTSRTTVADRARIPAGTMVVKLEPFSEGQVHAWVANWNEANAEHLASRGLERLDVRAVLAHRDLAVQPILMLMLALYDAVGNGLKEHGEALKPAALYERLLTTFIEREVRKDGQRDRAIVTQRVEAELYRLSIVAFAMFNRGAQIVHETDLDDDFRRLQVPQQPATPRSTVDGFYAPLSPAQRTLGRFFFVHRYEASDTPQAAGSLGKSFEFLHATFGEFLVARATVEIVKSLAAPPVSATPWRPAEPATQSPLLRALLSFQALTKRRPVVDFVIEIVRGLAEPERDELARTVAFLLRGCMGVETDSSYADYLPTATDQPRRYAHYSHNLCLIYLATRPGRTEVPELAHEGFIQWRMWAGLWQSQLDPDAARETALLLDIEDDGDTVWVGLIELRARTIGGNELDTSLRWCRLKLDGVGGAPLALLQSLRPTLGSLAEKVIMRRGGLPAHPAAGADGVESATLPLFQLTFDDLDETRAAAAFAAILGGNGTYGDGLILQLARLAVQYGRRVDSVTMGGVHDRLLMEMPALGETIERHHAYADLLSAMYMDSGDSRLLERALELLTQGDPARSVEALIKLELAGVLDGNLSFASRLKGFDLAEVSRESPMVAAQALNLLVVRAICMPRDQWLRGQVRQVYDALTPEARELTNKRAVELVLQDTGS